MKASRDRVCPVERAGSLDNRIRRWLQNPRRILAPYVREGMTALDVGCGPGFFSIELAHLVGPAGRVLSVDLQEGMLRKLEEKTRGTDLEKRITLLQCSRDTINVSEQVDFILAFYMVHEVPDKNALFRQLLRILKGDGQFLLVEPRFFHVSREDFALTTGLAETSGFRVSPGPGLLFSWSALLRHP